MFLLCAQLVVRHPGSAASQVAAAHEHRAVNMASRCAGESVR